MTFKVLSSYNDPAPLRGLGLKQSNGNIIITYIIWGWNTFLFFNLVVSVARPQPNKSRAPDQYGAHMFGIVYWKLSEKPSLTRPLLIYNLLATANN
jgi:hypothetical protein